MLKDDKCSGCQIIFNCAVLLDLLPCIRLLNDALCNRYCPALNPCIKIGLLVCNRFLRHESVHQNSGPVMSVLQSDFIAFSLTLFLFLLRRAKSNSHSGDAAGFSVVWQGNTLSLLAWLINILHSLTYMD